jgi:hypothetical protein
MQQRRTETVITELTDATFGPNDDPRHRFVFSQALHNLVRLAKSEQLLEMRRDAELATGLDGADLARGPQDPHQAGR